MNTVTEKQRLSQSIFIWVILGIIVITECVIFFVVKKNEVPLIPSVISIASVVGLVLLVAFICTLETRFSPDGIEYRFSPFHFSFRKIAVSEIKSIEIRAYRPLLEYGGWGIRGFRSNRAYNVSGNQGVQVVLKNGNKVLFGTKDPSQLADVVMQMNRNIK